VKAPPRGTDLDEDGMKLLRLLGPGALRFDVTVRDEAAVGHGPTQEFFTIFSQELGVMKVTNPIMHGLYKFYEIAVLCRKALLIGAIASFPFNPAFFKLILGRAVAIEEVDAVVARSLAQPEGLEGLPFSYPGMPEQKLCPGGSIGLSPQQMLPGLWHL
jgi:hypothetical protein